MGERSLEPLTGAVSGGATARPRTVVTGAGARVGLATAKEFASRGHDLVMVVRSQSSSADEARKEVIAAATANGHGGVSVELLAAQLDRPADVDQLCATIGGHAIDVLVHCAAVYRPQPIGRISRMEIDHHLAVNAVAPLLLTQAAAPALRRSTLPGGGAVVFFTDMHVMGRPYPAHAAYFASKGAVSAIVESLAVELAPEIRVNGIAPGVVAWPTDSDPEFQKRYIERTPLGRAGTPQEAARCAAWLALEASFVVGETVRLDGGRWLR